MTVIASGLGAQAVVKAQPSCGGTFITTGQRTLIFKTIDLSIDPHVVNGGPYLAAGQLTNLLSARVLTWQDAKFTIKGDMQNTAMALLLACALGSPAALTEIGTTTAYELGGSSGATASAPDLNDTWFDLQLSLPDTAGNANPLSFHSCVIQKAEWVFDRVNLVSYEYDCIAQQAESATTLLAATEPTSQVPFDMANASGVTGAALPVNTSGFAIGTFGSEEVQPGLKKITFTLNRKLYAEANRMYGGYQFQQSPVTDGYVDMGVSIETDFTPQVYTDLVQLLLSGDPTSVVAQAVGPLISGTSYNTFSLNTPAFVVDDPKAYPSLAGPDVLKSTITGTAKIDVAGDPWLKSTLITADTTF